MNIQGYGSGSFADIMNSSHKRNQISLVNQIVSYKDTQDGEIYRAYFTDDKVTSHNAVGQTAWQTAINDVSHVQKIKESLGGITLYSQDNSTGRKALSTVDFSNGESISVFEADNFTKENPIYTVKHWGMIYGYMQMQYDASNLEGYLSLKSLYDCMTGGEGYER